MRACRLPLLALLGVVGAACGRLPASQHPLVGRDPGQGFVAAAYADTEGLLALAFENEMGNPGRVLDPADPLGVARLALLVEAQLGVCPNGGCLATSDADGPLAAFLATDLSEILPAAAETIDAWAALGVAHSALGLANLLEQVGALPATDVAAIGAAADALRVAVAQPAAVQTLDWSLLVPPNLPAGPVRDTILLHPPAPRPGKSLAGAAEGVVAAVAAALSAGWGDQLPFPVGHAAPDAAIQTLLQAPSILDFAWRGDLSSEADQVHVAGVALATQALAHALDELDWAEWQLAGTGWDLAVVLRSALLEQSVAIDLVAGSEVVLPLLRFQDPNAEEFVPNVPTPRRAGEFEDLRPYVELHAAGGGATLARATGAVVPAYLAPLYLPGVIRSAPIGHATSTIKWRLHAAAPIDHLDLRIHRADRAPFLHFIYRPDAADRIATATTFLHSSDPDRARFRADSGPVRYFVDAVAVDRLGRFSEVASVSILVAPDFTSIGEDDRRRTGDRHFFVDESGVIRFPTGDSFLGSVATTLLVARASVGGTDYSPAVVAALSGGMSVTFRNDDVVPHRLRSVYTPLYRLDPFGSPAAHAIGGVLPLDFGTVAPGASGTVLLPATVPADFRWTLMDVLDAATGPAARKVILTSSPPTGASDSPIGG